jgi:hypothetical protein
MRKSCTLVVPDHCLMPSSLGQVTRTMVACSSVDGTPPSLATGKAAHLDQATRSRAPSAATPFALVMVRSRNLPEDRHVHQHAV